MDARIGDSLLLFVHVPVHRRPDGGLCIEPQAANGLRLWAENFSRLIVLQPLSSEAPPPGAVALADIPGIDRIDVRPLPTAYRPDRFFRALTPARAQIRQSIMESQYLCFSIGGLFGDWGSVAALEAHRMNRPYSVWTDRVESRVTWKQAQGWNRPAIRARLTWRAMAALEHKVIRRAALGLFHGRETFEAYSPICRHSELVHNIHVSREDHLAPELLARKAASVANGPLRIIYTGRADAMKGPFDWIEVLARLAREGVAFQASWLGDGPLLSAMRERVDAAGLAEHVHLPGFVSDRSEVLKALRDAQVMLFCHQTPESPRCLIEALISGTSIVGYDSPYPRDLISGHSGGVLLPLGDITALTHTLTSLARTRADLADLITRAARDGAPFYDAGVFQHRSLLIRRYLSD